jgi:3'-phosphoadenosine 5'-phosphosulfate sulfotransferase (PAPS reductase)/FAD synthetase
VISEPVLTEEDRRLWLLWERAARAWSHTAAHADRVARALGTVRKFSEAASDGGWRLMWSGGKDSTAMVHLAAHAGVGAVRAVSVKDDLDFPGEEEYVRARAIEWSVDVEILHPPCSLVGLVSESSDAFVPGADIHGRGALLSRVGFYPLLRSHRMEHGNYHIALGMRAAESRQRTMNRATHGITYRKKDGQLVCQPIADWGDLDVYAYLFHHDIEVLPLYRCVRLSESPGRVRKSWWLPGRSATQGGTIWLRTYYPSLFSRLRDMAPQHNIFA